MCGNMSVPFLFRLDRSCARNSDFHLICNRPSAPQSCSSPTMSGHHLDESYPYTRLMMGVHYTLSDTQNKLTVFGCDTSALISDGAGTFGSGCSSYCREDINFTAEGACSGLGCLDQESFDVSDYKLPVLDDMGKDVFSRVVVDWVVEWNLTRKKAQSNRSTYACGANSYCFDFENGTGHRCFCEAGHTGNPFAFPLSPGCQGCFGVRFPVDLEKPGRGFLRLPLAARAGSLSLESTGRGGGRPPPEGRERSDVEDRARWPPEMATRWRWRRRRGGGGGEAAAALA
ncbi:hypothetical protein NL676_025412 [Syzygium grande]|nr:hypothetical protein NL676_025412 [Syzygium grande]